MRNALLVTFVALITAAAVCLVAGGTIYSAGYAQGSLDAHAHAMQHYAALLESLGHPPVDWHDPANQAKVRRAFPGMDPIEPPAPLPAE
jgi:hypothetical protein